MQCLSSIKGGVVPCARPRALLVAPRLGASSTSSVCSAVQAPERVGQRSCNTTPAQQAPPATIGQQEQHAARLQPSLLASSTLLALALAQSPALADVGSLSPTNPFDGITANSLYVTLGLFLMSVPGIWSQVKRAPASNKKRKTYEVDGPARPGAMPIDERARQIFTYFKKYNYEVKGTGEVISFVGLYAADKGQAAAVTFYTFCGMGSIALVLSTLYPEIGNWWYALTLLSPGAWAYYMSRGTRQEEMRVKMVTADDDQTIDIIIEGDVEEISRFQKELQLMEKGMIYVKGILEA